MDQTNMEWQVSLPSAMNQGQITTMQVEHPPLHAPSGESVTEYSYEFCSPNTTGATNCTNFLTDCEPVQDHQQISFNKHPQFYQCEPTYPNIPYANSTPMAYGLTATNSSVYDSTLSSAYGSSVNSPAYYSMGTTDEVIKYDSDPSPMAFPSIDYSTKECPICQLSFDKFRDLQSHLIVHSTVRPYQCQLCGSSCKRRSDWARHMRKHTDDGQKKFLYCEGTYAGFHWGCGRKYSRADARLKHWRGKSGFRCIYQFCLAKLGHDQRLNVSGSQTDKYWKDVQTILANYNFWGSTVFADMSRSATLSQNQDYNDQD